MFTPALSNQSVRPSENTLQPRLETFLAGLPLDAWVSQINQCAAFDCAVVAHTLQTFINETRATLALVESRLDRNHRVLEVGAGICLFSAFLKVEGYDIVALEPSIGGYEIFAACKKVILQHFAAAGLPLLEIPAGELTVAQHGRFDLIFSNNVIEHIPDWQAALLAMLSVLAPGGLTLHACPNYLVPYDPHYAIPVLKFRPQWARRLFAARVDRTPDIWESLNFLSYLDVRRFARRHGVTVVFEKGLLYQALKRFDTDPIFRQRHDRGVTRLILSGVKYSGLIHLLRFLPPGWSTPMQFSIAAR